MRMPVNYFDVVEENTYRLYNMDTEAFNLLDKDSSRDQTYPQMTSQNPQPVRQFTANWKCKEDLLQNIYKFCAENQIDYEDFDASIIRNAKDINLLTEMDFYRMTNEHGSVLYHEMRTNYYYYLDENTILSNPHETKDSNLNYYNNCNSEDDVKVKRSPGRPRMHGKIRHKKSEKKTGKVWEFLLRLLLDPTKDDLITWENREQGMFKFVSSDKVAKLWGSMRGNEQMNYEKLSRAMRYYYKSKILKPVLGKRLVYAFGFAAKGWRPNENLPKL